MEKTIELKTIEPTALLGVADAHIKLIESAIPATIIARGEIIKIQGAEPDVGHAHEVLHEMMETLSGKGSLTVRDVQNLIALVTSENGSKKMDRLHRTMSFITVERVRSVLKRKGKKPM